MLLGRMVLQLPAWYAADTLVSRYDMQWAAAFHLLAHSCLLQAAGSSPLTILSQLLQAGCSLLRCAWSTSASWKLPAISHMQPPNVWSQPAAAGRVQSVALRMVYERQLEIEAFHGNEFWTIAAQLATADGQLVPAALHQVCARLRHTIPHAWPLTRTCVRCRRPLHIAAA